jgi:hypothetical protein
MNCLSREIQGGDIPDGLLGEPHGGCVSNGEQDDDKDEAA